MNGNSVLVLDVAPSRLIATNQGMNHAPKTFCVTPIQCAKQNKQNQETRQKKGERGSSICRAKRVAIGEARN